MLHSCLKVNSPECHSIFYAIDQLIQRYIKNLLITDMYVYKKYIVYEITNHNVYIEDLVYIFVSRALNKGYTITVDRWANGSKEKEKESHLDFMSRNFLKQVLYTHDKFTCNYCYFIPIGLPLTDLAPPLLVDRESFMCTRNTYRDLLTDGWLSYDHIYHWSID